MPLSSINTGLQAIPDLTDIATPGKLAFQLIAIYNAIGILQGALDSYTGNTPAQADSSNQNATPEQTVLVGNTSNLWCIAGPALSAGYLVTLYNNAGVTQAQYSQANSMTAMCHGITMTSATAGQKVQIQLLGLFNFGGAVVPGQRYWLSPTVPGGLTATAPTTVGQIVQVVGVGVDTNSIFFNPNLQPVQL